MVPKWRLACGGQIRVLGAQLLDPVVGAKCSNILQDKHLFQGQVCTRPLGRAHPRPAYRYTLTFIVSALYTSIRLLKMWLSVNNAVA